jgi:hypothetical protein
MSLAEPRERLRRLLPLYVVVFMGFVGYSLMITVFIPMLLRGDRAMLPPGSSRSLRTIMYLSRFCSDGGAPARNQGIHHGDTEVTEKKGLLTRVCKFARRACSLSP